MAAQSWIPLQLLLFVTRQQANYLELSIFLGELVLNMQEVLGSELTKAEDAQKVEVCQVAGVLSLEIAKGHNAHYPLQCVQVCVPDLHQTRVAAQCCGVSQEA